MQEGRKIQTGNPFLPSCLLIAHLFCRSLCSSSTKEAQPIRAIANLGVLFRRQPRMTPASHWSTNAIGIPFRRNRYEGRMLADAAKPIFGIAIVAFAPMNDGMPKAAFGRVEFLADPMRSIELIDGRSQRLATHARAAERSLILAGTTIASRSNAISRSANAASTAPASSGMGPAAARIASIAGLNRRFPFISDIGNWEGAAGEPQAIVSGKLDNSSTRFLRRRAARAYNRPIALT